MIQWQRGPVIWELSSRADGSLTTVPGNVLTLPVAKPRHTEPTLRAIKHCRT